MGKRLAVLGATGSVGRAALEVAQQCGKEIVALAAGSDAKGLAELCSKYKPEKIALARENSAHNIEQLLDGVGTEVSYGDSSVARIAAGDVDEVVAAIVGVAGVNATLAAARAGKRILLANKESLIVAGPQLLEICSQSGGELIPVDSEHSALLELLHMAEGRKAQIAKVWLTATGGPFLHRADFEGITPAMACAHPVWSMGNNISINSATLMNKGLEVIEACYLFGLKPDQVDVVIHPQAIIHAIVEFTDGCSIAHCGPPDMRSAISRAMAWPSPSQLSYGCVDWPQLGTLEFIPPDLECFPCLDLARGAIRAGGVFPAVLNAANEVAVAAFADGGKLDFTDIPTVIKYTMKNIGNLASDSIDELLAADAKAREIASSHVMELCR